MIGTVVIENINGRTLVEVGNKLFITNYIGSVKGEEIAFEEKEALQAPSFLFALGLMAERDLKGIIKFVKENW